MTGKGFPEKWTGRSMSSSKDKGRMEKKASLKANFAFNFISQILVLIIPLITAPYLARVFGAEVNGRISFSTSIITYFTLAANFGFTTYGQREIARYQNDAYQRSIVYWEIFILRLMFTAISTAALLILVFAGTFDEKYKTFILIQSISVVACCLDPTFFYQGMEDFRSIAIRTVAIKVVCLVLIFTLVKSPDDAWIYVLFNALSTLLACILMWPGVMKRNERIRPGELHIWRHFVPAFLIFLPNLAVTIYSVLDKTMIGLLAANPDYENGCYEQAYKLNSIMLLLVTLISSVMIPRNAHDYASGDMASLKKHLSFSADYVWLTGIPLIVGCSVMAYSLSSWFLGEGYDEVPLLLQIMSVRFVASGMGVVFGDQLFIAIGKEKYATIALAFGAVMNFTLNIFFIRLWGATGAAITTAMTECLVTLITGTIAFRKGYFSPKAFFLPAVKKVIAAGIMFVPLFFLNRAFPYSIWNFIWIVLVGCATYVLSLFVLRDRFFLDMLGRGIRMIKRKLPKKENEKEGQ